MKQFSQNFNNLSQYPHYNLDRFKEFFRLHRWCMHCKGSKRYSKIKIISRSIIVICRPTQE